MIVAAPHAILDLCFCALQFAIDSPQVICFEFSEHAAVCVVADGLPSEQFLHTAAQRVTSLARHPQNSTRILARLLATLSRPFRDALAKF